MSDVLSVIVMMILVLYNLDYVCNSMKNTGLVIQFPCLKVGLCETYISIIHYKLSR